MVSQDVGRDLKTRPLTKADYDVIVSIIDRWWSGPTSALAHHIFFHELGEQARVVDIEGRVAGFLLGFIAPQGPTGYVHLVGIDPAYRRKHLATALYRDFEEACRSAGCTSMKAVTTLGNDASTQFHLALGWTTKRVENYAGPRRTRIVFTKSLDESA